MLGTFAFAVSGAIAGVIHRFDVFGVVVLAAVTATAGGVTRDVLIGAVPPDALADWHHLAVAVVAGLLTFFFYPVAKRLRHPVLIFDAVGLATFAVVGANKALAYGIGWPMAAVLGMLSAVGGGILRDVLSANVPSVLHAEIYAVTALVGALVVSLGSLLPVPQSVSIAIGASLCFALRILGLKRGWALPAGPKGRRPPS